MTSLNWDRFTNLPGAPETNFEKLCRTLIRRNYGMFGDFQELANQAGVEFHLKLTESCELGSPPRWFGWQCKWYALKNGQNLGKTRRDDIIDGIKKTRKYLPELTDWILWTKHTLTKEDQLWFYSLKSSYPALTLSLKVASDVEALMSGAAVHLRDTYFGELVVTSQTLADQHAIAVAPFRHRYQPEVHAVVPTERALAKCLLQSSAWSGIIELSTRLSSEAEEVASASSTVSERLAGALDTLVDDGRHVGSYLHEVHTAIDAGDLQAIKQKLTLTLPSPRPHRKLLARLRSGRYAASITSANLVADLYAAISEIEHLRDIISMRSAAVVAPAGRGKSELAVRMTIPEGGALAGLLFAGKDLSAGQGLDELVRAFKIFGKPAPSFEALVEAIDAAGERLGRRVPIVIDGLNEAEDPRDWKDELFKADELLKRFPHVFLMVTLRDEFSEDCLPPGLQSFELDGFEDDPSSAIKRYFDHYKIDATDEDLPFELLQHPLTLRIYCDVANPEKERAVGVEALPRSLTGLFNEYFRRVSLKIADASPRSRRIYQEEVKEALLGLAGLMWEHGTRAIEQGIARKAIADSQSWHDSLLKSMESEGVLIRRSDGKGRMGVAFTYDLLAGHLIAEYLLTKYDFTSWLADKTNLVKITYFEQGAHTFSRDTFESLAGLLPTLSRGKQLWQNLTGQLRDHALLLTANSDPATVGRETVQEFAKSMLELDGFAKRAYPLLRRTRAAIAHPYDAGFLDQTLRSMTNTKRDLSWSEWLRRNEERVAADLMALERRWANGRLDARDISRARWASWVLTTTSRHLRDLATRALYIFCLRQSNECSSLALDSLTISDPYVPERIFAAVYGCALATWADPADEKRKWIPQLAQRLVSACFMPDAPSSTRHTLMRQYLLGIIGLARRIAPDCIKDEELRFLDPPFNHLPHPFVDPSDWTPEQIQDAIRSALKMDFGNYTLGRLIPHRSNYDYNNADYISTRQKIASRMLDLGYEPSEFDPIDRTLSSYSRHEREGEKVDRYGKKYAWIAYFEMWGLRSDQNLLAKFWSEPRSVDADIDPSFPGPIEHWSPTLPGLFEESPENIPDWILKGPIPDYKVLLTPNEIQGAPGQWILLDGFLEETAAKDHRHIFSFLRGVLVKSGRLKELQSAFNVMKYPGNDAIGSVPDIHLVYAGEMPFSTIPGSAQLDGLPDDVKLVSEDRYTGSGVPIEVPVRRYAWSSNSKVNSHTGGLFPSPLICDRLGLSFRAGTWDLHDATGPGSLVRQLLGNGSSLEGKAAYLRADLMKRYLDETDQVLVWLIWGEREQHYRGRTEEVSVLADGSYANVHKRSVVWRPRNRKTQPK